MELKHCWKCNDRKPETAEYFYARPNGHFSSPCKECCKKTRNRGAKNKAAVKARRQRWVEKNRPTINKKQKQYRKKNKERLRKAVIANRNNFRLLALWKYGSQPPVCTCCGVKHIQFLCVASVKKRKAMSHKGYLWLKRRGYPPGYRVLCYNCSGAITNFGSCPHQS